MSLTSISRSSGTGRRRSAGNDLIPKPPRFLEKSLVDQGTRCLDGRPMIDGSSADHSLGLDEKEIAGMQRRQRSTLQGYGVRLVVCDHDVASDLRRMSHD